MLKYYRKNRWLKVKAIDITSKKLNNEKLTYEEIEYIINQYTDILTHR